MPELALVSAQWVRSACVCSAFPVLRAHSEALQVCSHSAERYRAQPSVGRACEVHGGQ